MKFYDYVVNCIFSKIIKIYFLGQLPLTVVSVLAQLCFVVIDYGLSVSTGKGSAR